MPPADNDNEYWRVQDVIAKRRYRVSEIAVAILIYTMQSRTKQELSEYFHRRLGIEYEQVNMLVSKLIRTKLLRSEKELASDEQIQEFNNIIKKWSSYGWHEAVDYHLLTFNYPFVGLDETGRAIHQDRMLQYSQGEYDDNRHKSYPYAGSIPLPAPQDISMSQPFGKTLFPTEDGMLSTEKQLHEEELSSEEFLNAMSLACAQVGSIEPYWSGEPLVLRSSPSGGARHPTETYIYNINLSDLNSGWYHVNIKEPSLERLSLKTLDGQQLARLFPMAYARCNSRVLAIIVFTSVFERNMYRYREPRTFRTIHMDAGHLASTLEHTLVSCTRNTRIWQQYGGPDEDIEKVLGLDGLSEGYMLSIGLEQAKSQTYSEQGVSN